MFDATLIGSRAVAHQSLSMIFTLVSMGFLRTWQDKYYIEIIKTIPPYEIVKDDELLYDLQFSVILCEVS